MRHARLRAGLVVLWAAHAAGGAAQDLQGFRARGDGGLDVAWVDPTNGTPTSLSGGGIAPTFGYSSGVSAIDRRGQRLFITVQRSGETDFRVYTLSLRDGSVLASPTIAGSGASTSFFAGLEYDEAEGVLYCVRGRTTGVPGGRQLCTLNPATGVLTGLGSGTPTSTSSSSDGSALDPAGNRYFFVGTPNGETDARIFTFSTATGAITANPTMTGTAASPILGLEYDPAEGVLYGLRSVGGARQLVAINTGTGGVVGLGTGTGGVVSSAGADALDWARNRFFLVGTASGESSPRLYTFDTVDGSVDANPVMSGSEVTALHWRETFPAKGDFNRDGQTDLLLRDTANTTQAWLMSGTTRASLAPLTPVPGTDEVISGVDDFDGNGVQDLAVYRPSLGTVQLWLLGGANGTDRLGAAVNLLGAAALPANWKLTATGDFDRDGWPDLLWRNTTSQKIVVWTLAGATKTGNLIPTPDQAVDANWEAVAALDFNRDGNRDLLWYNVSSGRIVTWNLDHLLVRSDGAFTNPMAAGDANWRVVAGGDYGIGPDGPDAAPPVPASNDLVWRNATSGKLVVWHLDLHRQRTGGVFTTPDSGSPTPTSWSVVGPR